MSRHRTGETPTPIMVTTPPTAETLVHACQALCWGPEGAASSLKGQVDNWRGAIALAGKILAVVLVLLTASITVAIAVTPSLVRSAARTGVREEVRAAVAEEFARHFGHAGKEMGLIEKDIAKAPWQVIPSAKAADIGKAP
jgi:hypothetical protein